MLSAETKRALARAATVGCLLIIVVLAALTSGSLKHNPLKVLMYGIAFSGMGYNGYFLYRWTEALASAQRKGTTLLIGAVWLLVSAVVSFVGFDIAFANCAGGCTGGGVRPADWLFMLSTWGIGVGFKRWLDLAQLDGPTAG